MSFNTIVIQSGVTLVDLTKITVDRPGVYSVGISIQFDKDSSSSLEPIFIWTRVNGEDVPDSAGEIRLLNNQSEALPFIPYTLPLRIVVCFYHIFHHQMVRTLDREHHL
jgi:hypothetical protein